MRRLFWFSLGFALACGSIIWLLWPYARWVLLAAGILTGCFLLFSRSFPWARYPTTILLGVVLGSGLLLARQQLLYTPLLALEGQTLDVSMTAQMDSVPGQYSDSVKAAFSYEGHAISVQTYLQEGQTARAGDTISGSYRFRVTLPGGSKANTIYSGKGIFATATPKGEVTVAAGQGDEGWYLPRRLSRLAQNALQAAFPEDTAAFAKSLLLGDTTDLSYADETALRISGIRHVVAVSGLHVAILMGILWCLCAKQPWAALVLGLPVLLVFSAMAGFTPSVSRACIMAVMLILARLFRRSYDGLTSLGMAVLLLLAENPFVITAAGFQLSVMCVLGILLFQRPLAQWLSGAFRKVPKGKLLADSLAVSLSALTLSLPLSVYYFGTVSLIAPVTNFLALWMLPFIFGGILLVCFLGPLLPGVAGVVGWLTAWPIRLVLWIARVLSRLPMAAVYTCSPYVVWWLAGVYGLVLLRCVFVRKKGWICACAGILSLAVITILWGYGPRTDDCRLTVLDVGQGQCLLLQSRGESALIDCGGYSDAVSADRAWQMLRSQNIYDLDLLMFTHYDADHFGGTENFLTQIPAEVTMLPGPSDLLPLGHVVTKTCEMPFGAGTLRFFPYTGGNKTQENSMVILFETENCAILVTGDLDAAGERRLVRENDLKADILVVGHHGSKYSTSQELLDAVQPELALISVGENSYGHPTEEVLERLEQAGCAIRRTDQEGNLIIRR